MLIVGSTGKIGRRLVAQLTDEGERPAVLVRDADAAAAAFGEGVDVVVADLSEPATLDAAVQGQDVVYLAAGQTDRQVELETNLVAAAGRAGVQRLVKVSALGTGSDALHVFGRWHSEIESAIEAAGIPATVLRPSMFMDNLLASAPTVQQGALYSTTEDHGLSWIDPADIAAVAAVALRDPSYAGRTLTLTGPEVLTYGDVAAKLSGALGREVAYVQIDDDAFRGSLTAAGLPAWVVEAYVEMSARAVRGDVYAVVTDDVPQALGRPAGSLDSWISAHLGAFTG